MKRPSASNTIENPFIKRQNKTWTLFDPGSLHRAVSPPPSGRKTAPAVKESRTGYLSDRLIEDGSSSKREKPISSLKLNRADEDQPKTAAVEAGEADVSDHLAFFSTKLLAATQPDTDGRPRVSHADWVGLYTSNQHAAGHHFVVHQHDHPVAGTHYDLRLQCNETSSISFAVMYGLPGDPNSRRLNRNATETRVHCLWNHLIETASLSTGSMVIWDTGTYEVLPYRSAAQVSQEDTDGEGEDGDRRNQDGWAALSEPQKLARAFAERKVGIRLNGTRLPKGYTLALRLTKENYRAEQPKKPKTKRKRKQASTRLSTPEMTEAEDSDEGLRTVGDVPAQTPISPPRTKKNLSSLSRAESPPPVRSASKRDGDVVARGPADSDTEAQDEQVRLNNAYPSATNSIGSVHQRKWYLSLDRWGCGFVPSRDKVYGSRIWVRERRGRGELGGFERFHVLGRDVERSVVTGRLAADVLSDDGVVGYVPRGLWRAVTE